MLYGDTFSRIIRCVPVAEILFQTVINCLKIRTWGSYRKNTVMN